FPLAILDHVIVTPERPHALVIGWQLLATVGCWAYSVCLHAYKGQTLGKMLTGVKVLDRSESRLPGFSQALMRDVVLIVADAICTARFVYVVATDQYTSITEAALGSWKWMGYSSPIWFALEIVTMLTN